MYTTEDFDKAYKAIKNPILDIEGDVLGVVYDKEKNTLYAGGISNFGASRDYEVECDLFFNLEHNLDELLTHIFEQKALEEDKE